MAPSQNDKVTKLSQDLLQAFDTIFGLHPGYRPAHAKGVMVTGTFRPAPNATLLTRAPHIQREFTPVTVRFSDSTGLPTIADNDPNGASPRGFAIRFHLADHVHTDIVTHSTDGFPVRTGEEFLEFLQAVAVSGPDATKPTLLDAFLATHPTAVAFVQTPKPIPTSFARESFFGVNAMRFTNSKGESRYGRFRIKPVEANEYLDEEAAATKDANFLFDELSDRLKREPVKFRIEVQLAESGDQVDDSTIHWPDDRPRQEFGEVVLTQQVSADDMETRRIIFDPAPRVDGIDPSNDPLIEVRSTIYLLSGRRRRAAGQVNRMGEASRGGR
jgi:catalase